MHVGHDDRSRDVSHSNHPVERLETSTRVLLDSPTQPNCLACGEKIDYDTQYKCVTVRERGGTVSERLFCGEPCLHEGLSGQLL